MIMAMLLLYHLQAGIGLYSLRIFFSRIASTDLILAVIPPTMVNGIINKSQTKNIYNKVENGIALVDY